MLALHLPPAPTGLDSWWFLIADPAGRRRILLVEDDAAMAQMYRLQLELEQYSVAIAGDAPGGLAAARSRPPDLILLDIRLPGGSGLDVLEALKSDPELAAIPVLVLSNYGDPSMITRALSLGAADYLVKSATTPIVLAAKVRQLLSRD